MITVRTPLFKAGRLLATPGCLAAVEKSGDNLWSFFSRHLAGDWGVVGAEDAEANSISVKDGSRIISAYLLKTGEKIWIITEAEDDHGNRAASTAILPSEY